MIPEIFSYAQSFLRETLLPISHSLRSFPSILDWNAYGEIHKNCFFANITFWTWSLLFTLCDLYWPWLVKNYKHQPNSMLTSKERWDIFLMACRNMLILSPISSHLVFLLNQHFGIQPAYDESDPFPWEREVRNFVIHLILNDLWIYATHRMFHTKALYRTVHKVHHRFQAPIAMGAVYAHWLEYLVGNIGGTAIGPMVTQCHPYASYAWYVYALTITCFEHCGYNLLFIRHDWHHEYFVPNYGNAFSIFEILFGSGKDFYKNPSKMVGLARSESPKELKRMKRL